MRLREVSEIKIVENWLAQYCWARGRCHMLLVYPLLGLRSVETATDRREAAAAGLPGPAWSREVHGLRDPPGSREMLSPG